MEENIRKAIVVVSSGTTDERAIKLNIEAVEREIEKNFSGYIVRSAFTSEKIINKLMIKSGIYIDKPEEVLLKLKKENFKEVVIHPLHIICGYDYERLKNIAEKFKAQFEVLALGTPLLSSSEDYYRVLEAIKSQIPELKAGRSAVLMGHGSSHESDVAYSALQSIIDKQNINIFIGTLKGSLGLSTVIQRLRDNGIKEVILMPLMLVAGNHAVKDMASKENNSWKSVLESEGFKVEIYLHGLGENKEIQRLYIDRLNAAISSSMGDD